MKDAENIVQTTIHIVEIVIIYLAHLLEWQLREDINVESAV